MSDYTEHDKVLEMVKKDQSSEEDNRERVREATHFVDKRDGQWEPDIVKALSGRPRYTFDRVNPIIDQIAGEIEQSDFDIRIRQAGGDATKETAQIYDGLIRNIESLSNASYIYSQAARAMITGGIAGWMVVQGWADNDSFDQDLMIVPINNFEDRVFFDQGAELQDQSDANHVTVLTSMSKSDYKRKWPDGKGMSVGQGRWSDVYMYKKEEVVVGQIFYKKPITKELIRFSDGSVREATDDIEKILDELKEQGITEESRRKRKTFAVWSRIFDGNDWLAEAQETVFDILPVVVIYGNFRISEGKIIYRGVVDKLIDPQRVYNYTRSREVEEVALAPRAKYWMTRKQAEGNGPTLSTLNTNADPVQFYTHDPENPGPPQQNGGAQPNQGLMAASQSAERDLAEASGRLGAGVMQGQATDGPMSGVAIQALQGKGDNNSIKYFNSTKIGILTTAKILVRAAPKTYDTNRQVRILSEDGSEQVTTINDRVFDNETQQWVVANDLTKGKYDVTVDVGPAFKNRQQETVKALTELMLGMPEIAQIGGDVLLNNINSPGIDLVAARLRKQLIGTGIIPEEQLTDEEKQAIAQLPPPEPTPQDKLADAEIGRVQAETADVISKSDERQRKLDMDEMRLVLQQQKQAADLQQKTIEAFMTGQKGVFDELRQQVEILKTIREAMGVDSIVGPGTAEAYIDQVEIVQNSQEAISQEQGRTQY